MSDNVVTMKTLLRRQLSREPGKLNEIKPGESVLVPDDNGGVVITRRKKKQFSPTEMLAQLDALPGHWPVVDTDKLMEDEA